MSDFFDNAVNKLLDHEGEGYVADDNGRGPSKWGVTYLTAKAEGLVTSPVEISQLTKLGAAAFYRTAFWNPMQLWRFTDEAIATKMLDLGVNMGAHTAILLLQRAVQNLGANLAIDGYMGMDTASAVNQLDPVPVLSKLREVAADHYRWIVASNPDLYAKDLDGWLARLES